MKIVCLIIVLLVAHMGYASNPVIKVIPYPQELKTTGEYFTVNNGFRIKADKQMSDAQTCIESMVQELNTLSDLKSTKRSKALPVRLIYDKTIGNGPEAYQLSIKKSGIEIRSTSSVGCFYGIQTLKQLITKNSNTLSLPQVEIIDYPKFAWRSYMLDESRYFYGKEFVIRMLDELAALKINKFHWHLTDDPGWRIEIKKYPELTRVGAYRKDSQIGGRKSEKRSGEPHGGFYTQDQIREIIQYASKRNIEIIPEIEMPGHSSAAIASYAWLGMKGQKFDVTVDFKSLDSYNITKPEVIQFIHDVLDEVCDLFPSKIIHIGGDEVQFDSWAESADIQAYMKQYNLNSPADCQIHFTNAISNYLAAKGKRMMGWNEILGKNVHASAKASDFVVKTTLAKETIIHFWKGDVGLITEAAQKGYSIVNSLYTHTYLDYNYKTTPLKKMYQFLPVPPGLETKYQKNIIGVGAQMWTEWTPTYKDVEYKTFPRIAAIAEVGWSGSRDYDDFVSRLKLIGEDWIERGINFPKEEIK